MSQCETVVGRKVGNEEITEDTQPHSAPAASTASTHKKVDLIVVMGKWTYHTTVQMDYTQTQTDIDTGTHTHTWTD